jgi:hypothetical protein
MEFKGNGKIKFDNRNEYNCSFTIHHSDSGDTEVAINTAGNCDAVSQEFGSLTDPSLKKVMLDGQTTDGYAFRIQITVRKFNGNGTAGRFDFIGISGSITLKGSSASNPSSYLCYLTNLLFYGTHQTALANGGWTLDRLPVQLLSRDCEFRMLDDRQKFRDSFEQTKIQITSVLMIPFQAGDGFESLQAELLDICDLLSFAQGCFVSCVRVDEIDSAGTVIAIHLLTTKTRPFVGGFETIPDNTQPEPHLKLFLESSLAAYKIHKAPLQLAGFLTYYLEAKLHNTKSIKFLLACIAAESIKSNYADWQGLPRAPKNFFERVFRWIMQHTFGSSPTSFRFLLSQTFIHFGISGEKFTFIKFRNNVIHTGDENLSFPDWTREHFKLTNQLDRLFLGICNYKGKYYDLSDNFAVKST